MAQKTVLPVVKAPAKASRDRTPRKQPVGKNSRKKAALRKLAVGQTLSGSIKNITDFGAFVDLGDVDGLIHKSRLGSRRVEHPSEVVTVGDTVSVMVVEVDVERERVSLALMRPR
ncbi:30S ribosomal protein S1 [Mycobacterium simulans]|uniref:S1 RNA-binding domain-containing protein n=1 Tax=Mycobacterium simulans TaxID=627089 RepID=UPI00174DB461|nr:30S ribosomal protein S1 [Mycobacterium simulans]